ncbi:hypothetical protein GCM10010226_43930 [Streptomyces phaeofaciens]|uniref:N-acetylmuramoyl-L-alanine amidase n=1 Tax=Streptomyces phaeofaciens TaxID=68254 RepID=A0A918HFU5_9ACTN|nr:hypothetical protein GCM10010226_43930 [Streptomyces phaeofaciens]
MAPVVAPDLSGSTQSLPLTPLTRDRALGAAEQGVPRRDVSPFSLLGVVWDNPDAELLGTVQVRTRAAGTGTWSGWQDVETHYADHGADPDTAERVSGHVRGATAPLWVGDSDGVEVRVRPDAARRTEETGRGIRTRTTTVPLPGGMRLELIDPGKDPESATVAHGDRPAVAREETEASRTPAGEPYGGADDQSYGRSDDQSYGESYGDSDGESYGGSNGESYGGSDDESYGEPYGRSYGGSYGGSYGERAVRAAIAPSATRASAANAPLAPLGALEIPALDRAQTRSELLALRGSELTQAQRAKPYIGPRPRIVTRRGWSADESLREAGFRYTTKVKAAFVHHSATGNSYKCSQAPSVIRGIYRYHVRSLGWRDIGYNFVVDKCGTIYEGRAGGVAKAVLGAHTLGFNTNSMGIAVLGTFTSTKPSSATVKAVAGLTAWKLGLFGGNPKGKTYLKSAGGNLYPKGKNVRLNVISGHRDGFATECPGKQLYGKLGSARKTAAKYQGR